MFCCLLINILISHFFIIFVGYDFGAFNRYLLARAAAKFQATFIVIRRVSVCVCVCVCVGNFDDNYLGN